MAAALARLLPSLQENFEDPALGRRLDRMLMMTGARADQGVCVAGPEAGDAMSGLWRRGFGRVEAARRCTCGCADEKCAVLLVLGGSSVEALADLVEAVSPMLAAGGRLAISAHDLASGEDRLRLCNRLAHRGFRYHPKAHLEMILLATKPGPEDFAQAC